MEEYACLVSYASQNISFTYYRMQFRNGIPRNGVTKALTEFFCVLSFTWRHIFKNFFIQVNVCHGVHVTCYTHSLWRGTEMITVTIITFKFFHWSIEDTTLLITFWYYTPNMFTSIVLFSDDKYLTFSKTIIQNLQNYAKFAFALFLTIQQTIVLFLGHIVPWKHKLCCLHFDIKRYIAEI
jgi:hypothetical protein